jgi:hypothetical protein
VAFNKIMKKIKETWGCSKYINIGFTIFTLIDAVEKISAFATEVCNYSV